MPYRCRDCRAYFSLKTGTVMDDSNLSLRVWIFGLYLVATSLKGVSSMKIHRDLRVTQKTAWFMIHRIREALLFSVGKLGGEVEVDEAYIGGKEKNKHKSKRTGNLGTQGKVKVMGAKQRGGMVVARPLGTEAEATMAAFVHENVEQGESVYTDEHQGYKSLEKHYNHETVKHSEEEYVRGQVHINTIESFWSLLKRGIVGTYHHMSDKHLHRYIDEFVARHNIRGMNTLSQMGFMVRCMENRRIKYHELIA